MTPKERLYARLKGQPVDKIPNLNIVMLFAAKHGGVKYGDFCSDFRKLAAAQAKTAGDFGIDILSAMSDSYREASDFGAAVRFKEDDLPVCDGAFLASPEDFHKLKPWEPMESTRMRDRIDAVRLFKEEYGEHYPILGWVEGAWAEFTDLATMSEGMVMMMTEPDAVLEAMDRIADQAVLCALAQLDAGADIIGIGDAAASLISVKKYREIALPFEKRIVDAVHKAGGKTKLHICGNVNHLLEDMFLTGSDIVDIDYMVDYEKAVELSQGKCSICGNINPVETLLQGTVEEVMERTRNCAEKSGKTGIVSSGCEVPKMTPPENLTAVDTALRELADK